MRKVLPIIFIFLEVEAFILSLTQQQTCFEFYPDYDNKKHQIYFLASHGIDNRLQASIQILDNNSQILNSSQLYPFSHHFEVNTITTDIHKICIRRSRQIEMSVHLDIIDEEHLQQHTKAGKEDIIKLVRSASIVNMNLAKLDLTQKSIYQKSKLQTIELISQKQHLYMLFFIKVLVMIMIAALQYWVIKKFYK